jgi:hypothetical protein
MSPSIAASITLLRPPSAAPLSEASCPKGGVGRFPYGGNSGCKGDIPPTPFAALDFTLDRTAHTRSGSMIRRCIAWRNRNAQDTTLPEVQRANVA